MPSSFSPRFFSRGVPLTPILTTLGEYTILDTAKEVTITGSGDLTFGTIAVDTAAVVTLEYVSTQDEDFVLGVGVRYTGDAGAFQITAGDGTGDFATPIDLMTGGDVLDGRPSGHRDRGPAVVHGDRPGG